MVRVSSRNRLLASNSTFFHNIKRSFYLYSIEELPEGIFVKLGNIIFLFCLFVFLRMVFNLLFRMLYKFQPLPILDYLLVNGSLMGGLYFVASIFLYFFYGIGILDGLYYSLLFTIHSPIYYFIQSSALNIMSIVPIVEQIIHLIGFLAFSALINYLMALNIKVVLNDQREMLIEYIKKLFVVFTLVAIIVFF